MSERAEALFLEFLRELEREPAADFDALCARHGELADELRWLQERHARADAVLRALEVGGEDTAASCPGANGRYEVLGEIARGGMSRIFEVWDRDLRRKLAMKVPAGDGVGTPPSGGSPRSSRGERLLREAHVLGQIEHPGIVPVHETGEDSEGRPFFTMRCVRGRHFGEVIQLVHEGREGWTLERAVAILQRVCEAVAYAHSRGVVHRDLKPANVMVGPFGETYVMDWGLAKVLGGAVLGEDPRSEALAGESASALSPALTLEGDVVGTPAYMPPEQAEHGGEVTTAADVYAAGAILYHLLTGHAPYGDDQGTSTPQQILAAVRRRAPKQVGQVARHAPIELVAVCEKAMQREPVRRYTSMLELSEDLRAFTEGRVVRAYRTGAFVELRKWMGRNRLAAAALVVAVVALGVGAAVERSSAAALEEVNEDLDASNTGLRESQLELEQRVYFNEVALASAALEAGDAAEAKRRLAACPEELRQWEWHWLRRRVDTADLVFQAQELGAEAWFSPDGTILATQGADTTVGLWDAATGRLLRMLDANALYMDVRWSSGGERLAVFQHHDHRHELQIFRVETGERVGVLNPHRARIRDVAWSADGRWLVSASVREIVVYAAESLEEVRRTPLDTDLGNLEVLADGVSLVVGGTDGRLTTFDVMSGESRGGFDAGVGSNHFRSHPAEPWIAAWSGEGTVAVWDVSSAERIDAFGANVTTSAVLDLHPDQPWIAVSREAVLEVLDFEDGTLVFRLTGHDHSINWADFSPDGRYLASTDLAGVVRVWDLERPDRSPPVRLPAPIWRLGIHPEQPIAACAFRDRTVRLWRRGETAPFQSLELQQEALSLSFTADGRWLAIGDRGGTCTVWDWEIDEVVLTRSMNGQGFACIRPDGERLAGLAAAGPFLRVWTVPEGDLVDTHQRPTSSDARSLAYSPDGQVLAVGDAGGIVWLLDGATGTEVGRVDLPQRIAGGLSFSPGGERLATVNGMGPWAWGQDLLVVHQLDPPRKLWETLGEEGVHGAIWTGDGTRLLTSSRSGLLNVWDAASGRRIVAVGLGEEHSRGLRAQPGYAFASNRAASLLVTVSLIDHALRFHDTGSGN